MYYSSKTESYDQENQNPNEFYDHPTMTQGMFASDAALSKALDNIAQLQENLSFMLDLNTQLRQENEKLKENADKMRVFVRESEVVKQKQIKELEAQRQEVIELLETTKETLLDTEAQLAESRNQIQKCNRIIYEQKKAYEELEHNYMNQSLSYVGDTSSLGLGKSDLQYITELQKQNREYEMRAKRYEQQLEKDQARIAKLEKESAEFKKWMASVLGLQKVVEGSEKILMKEIGQRIVQC